MMDLFQCGLFDVVWCCCMLCACVEVRGLPSVHQSVKRWPKRSSCRPTRAASTSSTCRTATADRGPSCPWAGSSASAGGGGPVSWSSPRSTGATGQFDQWIGHGCHRLDEKRPICRSGRAVTVRRMTESIGGWRPWPDPIAGLNHGTNYSPPSM